MTLQTTQTTTIGNANVTGNFKNTSKDTNVTGKLTVDGETNIDATNSIHIADADLKGNLNTNSQKITIDELNLAGNINAKVDDLKINTSNNLNIGSISGNTKDYTTNLDISSGKSIFNGRNDNGANIYAQIVNMTASDKISTAEKPLNIVLVNGNELSMTSGNSISLITSGAEANYNKLDTDNIALSTNDAININTLNVKNASIKTTSNNLAIHNMTVGETALFETGNKKIAVDNTSLNPIIDADIQMYTTKNPAKLIVDGGNNIIADSVNVTRQNEYILINMDNKYSSMNSAITSTGASAMKNTNVGEKTIEKTDKLLDKMPTVHNYVKNTIGEDNNSVRSHLVKT